MKNRLLTIAIGILLISATVILLFPDKGQKGRETDQTTEESVQDLEEVQLIRVVDGDTIVVNISGEEQYVRLIGIDCPESVNPDESKNTPEGIQASDHTKEILSGITTVYLEYDTERIDDYGRILAYVWYIKEDGSMKMLNEQIFLDGYAAPLTIEPNTKHMDLFSI